MVVIDPLHKYTINSKVKSSDGSLIKPVSIFLAGTIDDGKSRNWQSEIIEDIGTKYDSDNITVYNPRRDDWSDDNYAIEKQILWEQENLDKADYIFMNLESGSKSPISLLELGLYAQSNKLIVFCNDGFYRYTNVKLTCNKYNILQFQPKSISEMGEIIWKVLTTYNLIKSNIN